jgi:hypothetical protein
MQALEWSRKKLLSGSCVPECRERHDGVICPSKCSKSETAGQAFRLKFQVVDSVHSSAPASGFVCRCCVILDLDGHILGTVHIGRKLRLTNQEQITAVLFF